MNFRKLLTCLTVSTAAVIPFASAQNPTILQGSYISNVFGNSNFVLNPNAQTNVANVTTVTATVARSTTTPLVATSEFTVAIGTANGTATWATRAFDAGMKNQNCEARFTYRGFQATSKVQIKQSTNVVAELVLTPSATDPRIASINFPCGDLSAATTFVVTDTAILAGTNEIGGIYVGLATNMANVAQAEEVGTAVYQGGTSCGWSKTGATSGYESFVAAGGTCNWSSTGTVIPQTKLLKFDATLKPGKYQAILNATVSRGSGVNNDVKFVLTDGTNFSGTAGPYIDNALVTQMPATFILTFDVTTTTTKTIELKINATTAGLIGNVIAYNDQYNVRFALYRFPSSSELVVTPERQNTWGGVQYRGAGGGVLGVHYGSTAPTAYAAFNNAVWNQPTMLKGKASLATSSVNDLGFSIANLPVGSYGVTASGFMVSSTGGTAGERVRCNFRVRETTTSTVVAQQAVQNYVVTAGGGVADTRNYPHSFSGVYNNTSVATRNFILEAQKFTDTTGTGTAGACEVFSDNTTNSFNTDITILLTPLDQPSNSALYVQGPVKAAATGAAIPAGYVGEVKHSATTPGCGFALQYNDGASVSLTPGIWQVTSQAVLGLTTTSTVNNWIVFTGPTTGNIATWRSNDLNDYSIAGVSVASVPGITQPLLVKYDGTNLFYFANGSYTGSTASASGTIYAKYFRNHSGTCGALNSSITAIRLN